LIRRAYLGVDIGQASDPSAFSLCERKVYIKRQQGEVDTYSTLHVTAFSRFKLWTPYTEIVRKLAAIVALPDLCRDIYVIVDCTRERAIYELMRQSPDFHDVTIIPITITGGTHVSEDAHGWYNVPEAELLSALTVSLESERLVIDRGGQGPDDEETLNQQLTHIKRKVSAKRRSVGMSVDGTEVEHDDMAFSLALGVWYARYLGAFEGPRVYRKDEIKPFDPARYGLTG
jgi:hypothetical protein